MDTIKDFEIYMKARRNLGIKPGLNRVHDLLKAIRNPEKQIKAVHVAGTNGKGSTIEHMKNAMKQQGYITGVFTSPSFTGYTGHFMLNDQAIETSVLINHLNKLMASITVLDHQGDGPTEFEILTVLAFSIFKDYADIVFVETGMGGRYDTTNVIEPIVSVITNISMDHMNFLGNSLGEIAYHKAGIIKSTTPVVTGRLAHDALQVVSEEAAKNKAPLTILGKDFDMCQGEFKWKDKNIQAKLRTGLRGQHQQENLAVAYAALCVLSDNGFSLDERQAIIGLSNTLLPGRFESISQSPSIVIDSAHNIAGIKAFMETVQATSSEQKDKVLIFAGFKDKQLMEMMAYLKPYFPIIYLTSFEHNRAARFAYYESIIDGESVFFYSGWQTLIKDIYSKKELDTAYYITGSLNFITEVRDYINLLKKYR